MFTVHMRRRSVVTIWTKRYLIDYSHLLTLDPQVRPLLLPLRTPLLSFPRSYLIHDTALLEENADA